MARGCLKTAFDDPLTVPGTICWRDGFPLVARGALLRCSEPISSVSCYSDDVRETLGGVTRLSVASSQCPVVMQGVLGRVGPLGPNNLGPQASLLSLLLYKILCELPRRRKVAFHIVFIELIKRWRHQRQPQIAGLNREL